jgi:hypothetical protein
MYGRFLTALLIAGMPWIVGCTDTTPPAHESPDATPRQRSSEFDAAHTGTIRGQVKWQGDAPVVPPFEVHANLPADHPGQARLFRANPNAPVIDEDQRGVAGAVVLLRGVDSAKARPWDHPPVRVEQRDRRLHIVQGANDSNVGFVRVGDQIDMVSREARFHSLRASGAAFFTLAFPDPDQPLKRRLNKGGLVELSSGAGYYWMRGYLFVDEHPYYTRTDAQGRFELPQVPAGRYQLICWLPSWLKANHDRDPETGLISRLYFRAPVEQAREIDVARGSVTDAGFLFEAGQFEHY